MIITDANSNSITLFFFYSKYISIFKKEIIISLITKDGCQGE